MNVKQYNPTLSYTRKPVTNYNITQPVIIKKKCTSTVTAIIWIDYHAVGEQTESNNKYGYFQFALRKYERTFILKLVIVIDPGKANDIR